MASDQPHDGLFREVFRHPEQAARLLRSVLPAALAQRLDPGSLKLEPGSFVDPELARCETDLLFSARVEKCEALLYVLVEHQSTVDPLMAWRVLRYVVRIVDEWLKGHAGSAIVPAVIPVVVYHGAQSWTAATDVRELFELPAEIKGELAAHLPSLRFVLDDLARQPDEAIGKRGLDAAAELTLLMLKHLRVARDTLELMQRWAFLAQAIGRGPRGFEGLVPFVVYLLNVREADEAPAIGRQLALWTGEAKDTLMVTIAQKWFEDGREKGREQGRDEGARELLFRLLRRKFGELPAPATERVLAADHATLLAWTERVLTAATLDDVFVA